MKKNYLTQTRHNLSVRSLLLMLLVLLPGVGWAETENIVTLAEGADFSVSKSNLTLADGASVKNLNAPTLNADNYYEIYNVAQMKWFAGLINGTLTDGTAQNKSANAILMADLDLENEPWAPMANYTPWYDGPYQTYSGIFDGNYHTISNLKIESGFSRGFFGRTWGATVKNLGIINAEITPGEGWVGVIVATVAHATIQNCWTAGNIVLADGNKCNGVAGVANLEEFGTATNCHTSYSAVYGTLSSNRAGTSNCTAGIPSDAYKTGELAYLLNTNKAADETCSWGQTIGTDSHPVELTADNAVYQYGKVQEADTLTLAKGGMTTLCFPREVALPENVMAFTVTGLADDSEIIISNPIENTVAASTPVILLNAGTADAAISLPATNGIFSNSATSSTAITADDDFLTGTYSDLTSLSDGQYAFASATSSFHSATTYCGAMPSAYQCYLEYRGGADTYTPGIAQYLSYPTQNSEGYYEIYTATHLKWFRDLVNGNLTDGTVSNNNANGKLMADIDLNNEAWEPIGPESIDGTSKPCYYGSFDGNYHAISNLNVEKGTNRGLFGYAAGGTIKNLGIVNARTNGGKYVGAIVGYASQITMQNCWTGGEINLSAEDEGFVAGIVNVGCYCTATNCYTSYDTAVNEIENNGGNTITNCKSGLSSDAYKTGELAYLLNENKGTDETGWGQTIGTDAHPVALIDGTNNVYQHGTAQDATTITINVDQYYNRTTTLCFPKDITLPDKVKAFTVTEIKNGSNSYLKTALMSALETSVVPANTPVILMNIGTEAATVQLPSVSGIFSNNASESTIITQDGNLLKGTYSSLGLNGSTQGCLEGSTFFSWNSKTLPAYQCYIELESGSYYCGLSTDKPLGEIEYAVLSEDDKTCYVSQVIYAGVGTSDYEVNIPSTTKIDGDDYKVVQFGLCTDDAVDKCRFINMNGNYGIYLYINLPKTINTVSRQSLSSLLYGGMDMSGETKVRFSTEDAPEFKSTNTDLRYFYAQIEVPYATEDVYKAAWGNDNLGTTSRKTEVDIANGEIEVKENSYTQGGTTYSINGTLVIKGTSNTNYVLIEKGETEDEPLRIAINGLSIDQSEVGDAELPAMTLYGDVNVSLIVQGENTFKNSEVCCSIDLGDGGSLVINPLSTGTLNVSSISGDAVTVAAKVYNGTNDYTTQDVTKTTELDTDNNQLAFSDYSLVTGVNNLVANGTCSKFVLNDAIDIYSPSAFNATEVAYHRTFKDNDFESLYLPFSASVDDFTDCEFYLINMFHQNDTDGDGVLDNITLEVSKVPVGSTLLPNHPYLFKYKGTIIGDDVEFNLTNINVSATESTTYECSSMSYKYEFTGNCQSKTAEEYADYYVIGTDDETGKVALVHPTETLPAMRWAMKMTARESQLGTSSSSAPAKVAIIVTGEEETTGITTVGSEVNADAIYGINGARKSTMTKGINIVKTSDGKVVKVVKQ